MKGFYKFTDNEDCNKTFEYIHDNGGTYAHRKIVKPTNKFFIDNIKMYD